MILATLIILTAVVTACLGLLARQQAHARQAAQDALQALQTEAGRHREQVDRLLQRIQAPQQAVIDHAVREGANLPQPDGRPLTEEESAQASDVATAARIALEQIEQMENEFQPVVPE